LQFYSVGSINFHAFDIVETYSAKFWIVDMYVDNAFS
jgi:hypothetical protein